MEKALENVSRLLGRDTAQFWRNRFERVRQMPGASREFKRIANTPDKGQIGDYLAEIRYALVFAGLGFQIEIEPLGKNGPDFRISRDGHTAFLEVARFRLIHPGPPKISLSDKEFLDDTFLLESYGDPARDLMKAFDKIEGKFRQIGDKEAIIAIWNDDEDLEEIEMEQVPDLFREAAKDRPLPKGLSFVLYGSNCLRKHQQLYCFPLQEPGEPHQANWRSELESSLVASEIGEEY